MQQPLVGLQAAELSNAWATSSFSAAIPSSSVGPGIFACTRCAPVDRLTSSNTCSDGRVAGRILLGEDPQRRLGEADRDRPPALGHRLPGPQVERHAAPAPAVDAHLERGERLDLPSRRPTPSSSRYPLYCPNTTRSGSIGRIASNTLVRSMWSASVVDPRRAARARPSPRICSRWVTTMSRNAPVSS